MPSITIWPPPRLTRPSLDSPLVTNLWVLGSTVARVDDSSSDSPSPDPDVDSDASDRDEVVVSRAELRGVGGKGRVTGGGGGCTPPTVTVGVVTVATGVVTVGVLTVTVGTVIFPPGFVGLRRPCQFAFQAASAARRRPSKPFGTASMVGSAGPLNPFEASEASNSGPDIVVIG